ncbi:MAG: fibronectin type III domain-containing protein, partial [Deferribacteres bacterium]|nr:fibronectin type III domain-containing protein [Deferribacteres bacterium]
MDISWTAATDDTTQQSNIVYLIYMSTTSGGQDFQAQPDFTTTAGATSYRVTGLFASTTYYFVVRAKDEAG